MSDYLRPEGWNFICHGMNLRSPADSLTPDKYTLLKNIRIVGNRTLQTRPGYVTLRDTGDAHSITDIGAYATLGTDDAPEFLLRNSIDKVYLSSTGALVATMTGSGASQGASMIPFRPGASSQPWMYVATTTDYKKFSAPVAGNVTVQKVGLIEPQTAVNAEDISPTSTSFSVAAASWTAAGTAGAPADASIITDTAGVVLADPVMATRISIQVALNYFMPGMYIQVAAGNSYPVEEVWSPCDTTTIATIRYYSGATGMCMITSTLDISGSIGRGSIIKLGTGGSAEYVLVLSVVKGIDGTCAFECSTTGTFAAAAAITGVRAIVLRGAATAGDALAMAGVFSSITTGVGTLSQTFVTNPFLNYAPEDYIHITLSVALVSTITMIRFIFDVGTSPPDFVTSILTFTLSGASLAAYIVNGKLIDIHFPISTLGGSLKNCTGFQLELTTNGTSVYTGIGGLWVGGGGLPDIGDDGTPYRYRVRPRSSMTGARGNPSPDMRYGVPARRQKVTVKSSTFSFSDSQIDLLDIFRVGGSITSYRYLGTVPVGTDFTDNYFDTSLLTAEGLETDNFEPWPTIDESVNIHTSVGSTITVKGTWVTVVPAGTDSIPSTVTRWLPGTLVTLSGGTTVTLRSRPTIPTAGTYLFELEEAITLTPTKMTVMEPILANQPLPYLWGPDDAGTIFGCGDPFRPGTLYFTKPNTPDSAPQTYTLELSEPSSPLMGGAIVNGVSLVSGTNGWWAVYPAFSGGVPYSRIKRDVGRTIMSPWGHDTDGQRIYFWAKDCIAATAGGTYEDLSSEDLYPLFPHDGVQGQDIITVGGIVVKAPDYSRAATFRLRVVNTILYADYQDTSGAPHTLVYDIVHKSWSLDIYANAMTIHYSTRMQSGPLRTVTGVPYKRLILGDTTGKTWTLTDLSNDNLTPISCAVGTFEFNGGDVRMQPQFGDLYIDLIAPAGASIQPVTLGAAVAGVAATVVSSSVSRQFVPVSLIGEKEQKTVGLLITWTDDFSSQSVPTRLISWQPSLVGRPEITKDRFGDWSGGMRG